MQKRYRVLTINPKSTSTLISIFQNERCIYHVAIQHEWEDKLHISTEVMKRKAVMLQYLTHAGINMSKLAAVSAVGGLLRPVEGGTYFITEEILTDLRTSFNGEHTSNLGGIIAYEIAAGLNIPSFIVDPPVVDEMSDLAKYSGLPHCERKSIFHALNQKEVARQAAEELYQDYRDVNLIVAHLGNGITIGAHERGKVIDVNNGLHGDGPFSYERTGTIPLEALIEICFSNQYSHEEVLQLITKQGGLKGYLQADTLDELDTKIAAGDVTVIQIIQAMAFQIAKEIGSMATVLVGQIDGIVLTGPLAHSNPLTKDITKRVNWIADMFIYPGEFDLQALNAGTLRVLRGEEEPMIYKQSIGGEVI